MIVAVGRNRWGLALGALGVGLAIGALLGAHGVVKHGDVHLTQAAAEFESPRVVDMPVVAAIDRLVDDGYRVVVVGRGTVKLQELGFRGSVLRIVGDEGTRLRYCTARLPDCVPIGS